MQRLIRRLRLTFSFSERMNLGSLVKSTVCPPPATVFSLHTIAVYNKSPNDNDQHNAPIGGDKASHI